MSRKMVMLPKLTEEQLQVVASKAADWQIIDAARTEGWQTHLPEAEVVVGWRSPVGEHCLDQPSELKWLHNWGAGVDSLPLDKLERSGVILTDSSGVHRVPISETVLMMMLSLSRSLPFFMKRQMEGKWDRSAPLGEINGKTVAIVGVGEIGREIARLCQAFGMKVIGLRRSGQPLPEVERMYDGNGLMEMMGQADFVVNTLPHTPDTTCIFHREVLASMSDGAIFINIGRGKTVDEEALVEALQSGKLAAAGLDVYAVEPLPDTHPLWTLENVIILPHVSGISDRYNERALDIFLPAFEHYVSTGKPDRNVVDYRLKY